MLRKEPPNHELSSSDDLSSSAGINPSSFEYAKAMAKIVFDAPDSVHWVMTYEALGKDGRLHAKKAASKWKTRPSKEKVVQHLMKNPTNRVAVVPSSVGCGVCDIDAAGMAEVKDLRDKLNPIVETPSQSGRGVHFWLHLTEDQLSSESYSANRDKTSVKWNGDWRCASGYILLCPEALEGFKTLLESTDGGKPLPVESKSKYDFKDLFAEGHAKAKEKPKRIVAKAPKGSVLIPDRVMKSDEIDRLLWILVNEGKPLKYVWAKGMRLIGESSVEKCDTDSLMYELNNRYYYKKTSKDGQVDEVPLEYRERQWNQLLSGACSRTKCDPVLDYFRDCYERHGHLYKCPSERREFLETWLFECAAPVLGDTDYTRYIIQLIFLGPVLRRRHQGLVIKHYPVLLGPSGCGKTALVENILPPELRADYFQSSLNLSGSRKELYEATAGVSVVEISEMGGIHGAKADMLKSWTSEGGRMARLPYDKHPTYRPYSHFMVGTANPSTADLLPSDNVAAERFLLMELALIGKVGDKPNYVENYMGKVRDRLIAAAWEEINEWEKNPDGSLPDKIAIRRLNAGSKIRTVPSGLVEQHRAICEDHQHHPYEAECESITEVLINGGFIDILAPSETDDSGRGIWNFEALTKLATDYAGLDTRRSNELSRILKEVGFERKMVKVGGENLRRWLAKGKLRDMILGRRSANSVRAAGKNSAEEINKSPVKSDGRRYPIVSRTP